VSGVAGRGDGEGAAIDELKGGMIICGQLACDGRGGRGQLEGAGEEAEVFVEFEAGRFEEGGIGGGVGEDDLLIVEVEAAPVGDGMWEGAVGEGAGIGEVAAGRGSWDGRIDECGCSFDVWVSPVFAVVGDSLEGYKPTAPTGGIAEEVGVEEDGVWGRGRVGLG